MHPILLDIFGFQLPTYGTVLIGSFLVALYFLRREATRMGMPADKVADVAVMGLLFGLPTGQMWITGEYAYDVATGEEEPLEDPADAAREALFRNTR